ncbi:MAG: sensor histidine kinase [Rubrobacteraceae bacterium]|jgi:two-component system OmpR family sensor kinase
MIRSLPVHWRLTLFNALAIGLILMALGFTLFFLLRQALLSSVEDSARSRALTAAHSIRAGDYPNQDDIERLTLDGVFVIIRDGEGKVLSRTVKLAVQKGHGDTAWKEALKSGDPTGGTVNLSSGAPEYVYAVPVTSPGGAPRVVEAGKSYETAQEAIDTFAIVLIFSILAAFALSLGGAYILARIALSPVDEVVDSARKITESDLSKRLPVAYPGDKIGRLATTINGLLARLEAAFARREEALSRQRRFTADAGHELRTPLTSIGGYAQMLEEGGLKDPRIAREGVAAIRKESERMRVLVESLLSLARGDEGAPLDLKSQDLGTVVSEVVETIRPTVNEKAAVEYISPGYRVEAAFDQGRISQVVSILLDNAIKYTPKGGRVTVAVRSSEGRAELEVSDTGIGISREQLPHIFERFHRADLSRTAGGMGLGLAIALQIIEAHGGEIKVISSPGQGSTFTATFPKTPKRSSTTARR